MKNRLIILLMSVLLLASLLPTALIQSKAEVGNLLSVTIKSDGNTEQIDCWESEKGKFYFFLPAYADHSTCVFKVNTESGVYINGEKITDGQGLEDFELNRKYDLTFSQYGKKQTADLTFMRSENIAAMYIETESGNMDYIHSKKGNNEKGKTVIYTSEGVIDCAADVKSIAGRGNSTWDYEKKAYSIDFLNETNLLNMGAAQSWVLLANAEDPSNLRNKLVYDFANEVKLTYSPESVWVDLYLNGEYAGLYLLCERNDVNENRIDISAENGVILSWEHETRLKESQHTYIKTDSDKAYRVHYPKSASKELLQEIQDKCQAFENSLLGQNQDWLDMIDLESWARKYLIDEMFGNVDGYMLSHYIYYDDSDSRLHAGTVWDYDKAMGNDRDKSWSITNPDVFLVGRYKNFDWDKGYITALLQNKEFSDISRTLFENEFLPEINAFLHTKIPQYIKETKAAFEMNKVRWFNDGQTGTLEQEADEICDYITEHNDFLYSAWIEGEKYCKVSITNLPNDMFYTVLSGECLDKEPEISNTSWGDFTGLYYCDNDQPFDVTKPITEDTALYAKWVDSASNKADDLIKLIPIIVIAVLFIVIFIVDLKRNKKRGDEI